MRVKCFHCGKWFEYEAKKYEKCPHCGKGFKDLSEEAQMAVSNAVKTILKDIEQFNTIKKNLKNIEQSKNE